MAVDLGVRAGLALDNGRLYVGQRRVAEALQRGMLTRLPEPDHLHLVSRYRASADDAQVGGDWYDAFLQPDGSTVLVIGDVMGHDISAASSMGQLRNLLRGTAYDRGDSPADVLQRVDAAIRGLGIDALATCVVARIEQTEPDAAAGVRTLRWSNAGHPPPMLLLPDGTVSRLDRQPDLMLGVEPLQERVGSRRRTAGRRRPADVHRRTGRASRADPGRRTRRPGSRASRPAGRAPR